MLRKIIVLISAAAIIGLGFGLFNFMSAAKTPPPKRNVENIATVFVKPVQNTNVPTIISATGTLIASNRIEIYSEVQGLMRSSKHTFKAGSKFKKGESLVQIDQDVYEANLIAQRSNFKSILASALADISIDFPDQLDQWNHYLSSIHPEQQLLALPEIKNEQFNLFLSARNIISTYYNIINLELTLEKYNLEAPFNGILTEANITIGSLVRPGQKIGSFIEVGKFELETAVPSSLIPFLSVGQLVDLKLSNGSSNTLYKGKIVRKNAVVNTGTQTTNIYISVQSSELSEGMFMEATLYGKEIEHSIEVPRSVLMNNEAVFVLEKGVLVRKEVQVKYLLKETAIISGLSNGEQVLTKMAPNAYPGMKAVAYQSTVKK